MGWQDIELILAMDAGARQRFVEFIGQIKGDRDQRQFAKDVGVSLGAAQGWLKGKVPRSENLQKNRCFCWDERR